jgi:hypothetical protein
MVFKSFLILMMILIFSILIFFELNLIISSLIFFHLNLWLYLRDERLLVKVLLIDINIGNDSISFDLNIKLGKEFNNVPKWSVFCGIWLI